MFTFGSNLFIIPKIRTNCPEALGLNFGSVDQTIKPKTGFPELKNE